MRFIAGLVSCCVSVCVWADGHQGAEMSEQVLTAIKEQLVAVAPIFEEMPYFMSEEFSLVDCTVAPILWRLPHLGVELPPKQTRGLQDYQYRMFNRDAFQASLSEAEREMPRT